MASRYPSRRRASLAIVMGGSLLLAAALLAQWTVWRVAGQYSQLIETRAATLSDLHTVNLHFKTQVQEWKNVLLRGQSDADLQFYWQSFEREHLQVRDLLQSLEGRQLRMETRNALSQFSRAHERLTGIYRQGYDLYLANDRNAHLVDRSLRGIDREPALRLSEFTLSLQDQIQQEADALQDDADHYFLLAVLTLGGCALIVVIGVAIIVRNAIDAEVNARTRTDFLAKMSHEIRTPMNGVLGMSELLAATPLNEQQIRYNQAIHTSGQALLVVINDLLDYSRIESGKMTLEIAEFSLRGLLSNLYYLFVQSATEKGLYWRIDIAPELPDRWRGDANRINQILVNLVGNAIKFTSQGGVTLALEQRGDRLQFHCTDTGIGISPKAQALLFTAFAQADASIARRYGGSGLGLVISRELARQMAGELSVTSEEGRGSSFNLQLPLASVPDTTSWPLPDLRLLLCLQDPWQQQDYQRHARYWGLNCHCWQPESTNDALPECPKPALAVIDLADHQASDALARRLADQGFLTLQLYDIGQSSEWINSHGEATRGFKDRPPFGALLLPLIHHCLASPEPDASQRPAHKGIRPLNILAADDNAVNRAVISAMLAKLGHRCTLACDGEDAVAQYINAARRFDLILMDCEMPLMDGLGALRCIREIERDKALVPVPILALTANAYQSDREHYLKSGMDDVLTKPISLDRLSQALQRHVI